MSMLQLPDPKVAMTLDELRSIQGGASTHIAFSLTLECPLRCSHCIVSAAPEKARSAMSIETARAYAAQMKELAAAGIRSISFTGGEPTLAFRQLRIMADAAGDEGIRCGLVTSAHWARTPESAHSMISRLSAVRDWDISVDMYHQQFVPLEHIRNAYDVATADERQVTIRFTYNDPLTPEDEKILEFITKLEDASFSCQRVRALGRGANLSLRENDMYNPWIKPCLTQGMVVRCDGSIAPCCLNLVEERNHPFQFGDARLRPLKQIHEDYMTSPLLQIMRVLGLAELFRWAHAEGLGHRFPERLPDEACAICGLMMRDNEIAGFLSRKASDPEMQLKTAVLLSRVLGEDQMLRVVLDRFSGLKDQLPGYDEAWTLLTSNASTQVEG